MTLAILIGKPSRIQINLVALTGAILGLVAVTVGWEFESWWGRDIPGGLWIIMFSSWFALLSPLAGFGGAFGLFIDFNTAHRYDYTIIGDGCGIAMIAVAVTILSIVLPIQVGRGYEMPDRSRARRFLTVYARGFRFKL